MKISAIFTIDFKKSSFLICLLISFVIQNLDGQQLIKDLNPGQPGSSAKIVGISDQHIFYAAASPGGFSPTELYAYSFFGDSLYMVSDGPGINVGDLNTLSLYSIQDSLLIFTAKDKEFENELHVSNGTPEGTMLINEINSSTDPFIGSFYYFQGKTYFQAEGSSSQGRELWVTDGKFTGTQQLIDLFSGSSDGGPFNFHTYRDTMYFNAYETSAGFEWWKSDGTPGNTKILGDLNKGGVNAFDYKFLLTEDEDIVFFESYTNDTTYTVFTMDNGVISPFYERPKTVVSGPWAGLISHQDEKLYWYELIDKNDTSFFNLLRYDFNTAESDTLYSFIQSARKARSPSQFWYLGNDAFVLKVPSLETGIELLVSDGTRQGTFIDDIYPDIVSSSPLVYEVINGIAVGQALTQNGKELWISDGTRSGTFTLDLYTGSTGSEPRDFVKYGNTVYFSAIHPDYGREIFMTDGTDAGTEIFLDLVEGPSGSNASSLKIIGNQLYFTADDGNLGTEPYRIDLQDPCTSVNCPDGFYCEAGNCIEIPDPCDGISCPEGDACYAGSCYTPCNDENDLCQPLGENILASAGTEISLDAGDDYDIVIWSTGDTSRTILVSSSGEYWFVAYDTTAQFYTSDSIKILIECQADGGCPEGLSCVDGFCFETDPCEGIICPTGSECYFGSCYDTQSNDPCQFVQCPEGESCYGGSCYVNLLDPCYDVGCPEGTFCVEGECLDYCEGVTCPEGDQCYAGSCFTPCNDENSNCQSLGENIIALSGTEINLDAGEDYDIVVWSTGDSSRSILVNSSGEYWFIAYDTNGQFFNTDSIKILIECQADGGCPPGQLCIDGFCYENDPCSGIDCGPDQVCYQGSCYPIDICSTTDCPFGMECYAGSCYGTHCTSLTCPVGQICTEIGCAYGCGFDSDCLDGEVCNVDYCIAMEEACAFTECPEGNICVLGKCYPTIPSMQGNLNLSGKISLGEGTSTTKSANNTPDSVRVILFSSDGSSVVTETYTDTEGNYLFSGLEAGDYRLFIAYPPYTIEQDGAITLIPESQQTTIDIELVQGVFEWTINYSTGMNTNTGTRAIKIFPNPSPGTIYLSAAYTDSPVTVEVTDLTGRKIFHEVLHIDTRNYKKEIVVPIESDGLYIVTVLIDGRNAARELIKFDKQ